MRFRVGSDVYLMPFRLHSALLFLHIFSVAIVISCAAVIGKGGEQIASIQTESGCKVQFAPG